MRNVIKIISVFLIVFGHRISAVNAQMDMLSPSHPINTMEPMNSTRSFTDPMNPANSMMRSADPMDDPTNPMSPMHSSLMGSRHANPFNDPMHPLDHSNSMTSFADPMFPSSSMRSSNFGYMRHQTEATNSEPIESINMSIEDELALLASRKNYFYANSGFGTYSNFGIFGFLGLEYARDLLPNFAISGGANFAIPPRGIDLMFTFPVSLRYNFLTQHHRPYFSLGLMPTLYRIDNFWTSDFEKRKFGNSGFAKEEEQLKLSTFPFARLGYEYEFTNRSVIGLGVNAVISEKAHIVPGLSTGISF